jgi:CheY-like chemotaxis protein
MTRSILVIDDEEHLRMMVRLALEKSGYRVAEASSGEEGLGLFADGSGWDVVVLDQRMPGMDGLQTLSHIKQRCPGARVVMATAYPSIELAVDAMKLGALDFIRKPMTPDALRRGIEAALGREISPAGRPSVSPGPLEPRGTSPIMTLTMNGFRIVRGLQDGREPADGGSGDPSKRYFQVRTPEGREESVVVTIAAAAIARLAQRIRRAFPPESPFWTDRAESRLAAALWEMGHVPANGLAIDDLTPDDLDVASRWGE